MSRGAWTCMRTFCLHEKPFADPERAQKWRLSLASLLFLTVWSHAEAPSSPSPAPPSNSSIRDTCAPLPARCVPLGDVAQLCASRTASTWAEVYLPFCNAQPLSQILSPGCSGDAVPAEAAACRRCLRAYRYQDRKAQEQYEEFELLVRKYETDVYSVRTCMEECKTVYKPWLCSQYFQTTQIQCSHKIPCQQYCLEVQKRCPFILPDNDDLVHGGNPSFICADIAGVSGPAVECCDVRWDERSHDKSDRTHPSCQHRTSAAGSSASRLCGGKLKLCILVLVLLHTVAALSSSHSSEGLDLRGMAPLEENSREE